MRLKRYLLMGICFMIVFTLIACGKKSEDVNEETITNASDTSELNDNAKGEEDTDNVEADNMGADNIGVDKIEAKPTEIPARDLKGLEITIGDWWSIDSWEDKNYDTQRENDEKVHKQMMQDKYNFKIKQEAIAGWGEFGEVFLTSTLAGNPEADMFYVNNSFAAEALKQNLFYPVSDLKSFDFTEQKWDNGIKDAFTLNEKTYAFSVKHNDRPYGGVYWNKFLFEEAGLDPDLLYDLQKNGEWTWEKFMELASQLTVDSDNDGEIDVYGAGSLYALLSVIMTSNETDYFIYNDSSDRFECNLISDEALASVQFYQELYEAGYFEFDLKDFKDTKTAMYIGAWYEVYDLNDMVDDWGFVSFPVRTSSNARPYSLISNDAYMVIPSCTDSELAENIAFAYNAWTSPVSGYEEPDLTRYYEEARDKRAVDETILNMLTGNERTHSLSNIIPGSNIPLEVYRLCTRSETELSASEIAAKCVEYSNEFIDMFYGE